MIMTTPWLFIAGALCVLLAVIHTVLGEGLIFRKWTVLRPIPRGRAGIIRASWHALSLFGVSLGVILWRVPLDRVSALTLCASLFLSAVMIAVWTQFRHPGWIVMSLIALLVLLSQL